MRTLRAWVLGGVLAPGVLYGQNLVNNGSFEDYTVCPNTLDQIELATGWSNFRGSCDYFNSCSDDTTSVPENWIGEQEAATGSAYAGIICFSDDDGNPFYVREWLGTPLTAPLTIGTQYHVSFKACLTTGGFGTNGSFIYAVNKLGVRFAVAPFFDSDFDAVPESAALYNSGIIADSTAWTTVTGSFVADSAYSFLLLGNFFGDANTSYVEVLPDGLYQYAYYYIDDVCLSADPAFCTGGQSVPENGGDGLIRTYPNPCGDWIIAETGAGQVQTIRVNDLSGRVVAVGLSRFAGGISLHFAPESPKGLLLLEITLDGSRQSQHLVQRM